MATRPGDWSAVGLGGDPVPGDPAVINGLADAMRRLAETAGTIHDGLNALQNTSAQGQRFIGKTADALRGKVDEHLNKFAGSVRESFLLAEAAMRAYATAVTNAQSAADQALNAAQGMAQDDPRRQGLTDRVSNARGDLNAAVTQLSRQLTEAGQRMQMPVSNCELFWEAFEILTIIVSILAIFTGGLLGILAWAMNAVNFIKVAVDFSQGKANGLQLGLAFLGILFPSTKGIGGTLKALGKGIKAGGAGFLDDVARIARLTGTSRLVVAPLLLGTKLGAGLRGFLPLVWTGMKSLGRAGLDDWAKVTGNLNGAWSKAGAYGMVTLRRLGRFGVAALLPLNFAEIGVVGFRGAAALAFADRVLGIPQHSLRQMMARAGDLEYLMKGVHHGTAGAGHGPGFPGRAGAHLGTGPFGGLRPGPGLGSVSTDLFHLSLTRTPSLDFTQLGFAKLGDVLLPRTGAAVHTGTGAAPGLHAVQGLVTPPLPENFTLGRGGLAVPAAATDSAVTPLTHLDASLGQLRLDSNLLLPADTALGVVEGARHPSGLSLLADAPATGHGVEVPGGLAKAGDAVADSTGLARGALGHVEDLADLKFPELLALQQGEITLRGISSDGISFRIGRDTDVTVNAQSLSSLAAGSHGGVPHAAPNAAASNAAVPQAGGLPGTAGVPDGAVTNAASHAAAPHGGVPGALPAKPVPLATTRVAPPTPGTTAHAAPLNEAATSTSPVIKSIDAPSAAPVSALNSREQALALLKGGGDARPGAAGLSASAHPPAGGVSSRAVLDTAGVSPTRVDTLALDLVARPGRSADTAGTTGAPLLAEAAPPPHAPPPHAAPQPVHAAPTGDGAAPRGSGAGRTNSPEVQGDLRPTPKPGQTSPLGPATPMPTGIEGHAAAAVRNQLRLSIGHVITGGAADSVTADLRMQRYLAYENSLVSLRNAQRDAGAGAPNPSGAGSSGGPTRAQLAAQDRLNAAVTEVKDARKGLREAGVDPDTILTEVRTLNVRAVLDNGGVPGGSERPDLSKVLADEADEANTAASSSAGHTADDLADQHVDDLTGPHGGPAPGAAAPGLTPEPPARPVVTVGRVENPFAVVEGGRTRDFAGDPVRFLGAQPVYTGFELGIAARMPHLGDRLVNGFVKAMGEAREHWFVLVRPGDLAGSKGTLVLTPAVEKYVQAFAENPSLLRPGTTRESHEARKLFRELFERRDELFRPMADEHYLASQFVPYKPGSAQQTANIGNAVIRRNPGGHVGSQFVFTPDMTGCALVVTDVTDDTFRAWHYQSPNGYAQRGFAASFRETRNPTEWFGDARYLSPSPASATHRPGATNILWRQTDGSWRILSQEYRAPFTLELGAFTLPRTPLDVPLSLTPGNEVTYTKEIYEVARQEADLRLQNDLVRTLTRSGVDNSTMNKLQREVLAPITGTLHGQDGAFADVTTFEGLAAKANALLKERRTTAGAAQRAVDSLDDNLRHRLTGLVDDFREPWWLTSSGEEAGKRAPAAARPPASTVPAAVTGPGGTGLVPPALHPAETGPVPPAGHLAEPDAPAPAPPAPRDKGKGRADAQEPLPLPSPDGRPGARDAALAMRERARVRQDIITGGTTGRQAQDRLDAWHAYEIARSNLGELNERAGRELFAGSSRGPTSSQRFLQSQLDTAVVELHRAEERLFELGIDPWLTSERIDVAVAKIQTKEGSLLGGARRAQLPRTDLPQGGPAHLTDEAADSGAPAGGPDEPFPDGTPPDEAVPDGALPGALDETVPGPGAGPGHTPEPVAAPAPQPVRPVGHVDNPFAALEGARSGTFAADPVRFLDAYPVSTELSRGIRERMPGLSLAQSNTFVDRMSGWSRHWFVLQRNDRLPLSSHSALVLTPAVERYVQAFTDGTLFPPGTLVPRETRELFEGLAAHPGLFRPMPDNHYLASHYIPYKTGIAKKDGDIGNALIPRNPESGTGSAFVFTPEMNGCAIAVTDVTDDTFRAWHYQSPGGEVANGYATRFRAGRGGADFNGPATPERSVRDWFGDEMYLTPEHGSRQWKGATNILWRREDGTWHVVSQEYRATAAGKGLEDITLRRNTRVFPLDLTGGSTPVYTRRIYDGMRADEALQIEGELVSALAALSRGNPELAGSLQRDVLDRIFGVRLTEERELAAAGDFETLVETARTLGRGRLDTANDLRQILNGAALDAPVRNRLDGILQRFGDPRWARELEHEAAARLGAQAPEPAPAPAPTPAPAPAPAPEIGTLRISEPTAVPDEADLPVIRARDAYAEAYADRSRAQFELNEWNQRFAGGAGPSTSSPGPSLPETRLAAAEEQLNRAAEELEALGVDPRAVQAEIEETITRSGKESKGLPGGMHGTDPGEGSSATGPAGLPHQAPEGAAPAPRTTLPLQEELLTRAFADKPEDFFTSHLVSVRFDENVAARTPWMDRGTINTFLDRMNGWEGRHWFVIHRAEGQSDLGSTVMLTPAVEKYIQVDAEAAGLALYRGDSRLPAVADAGEYLSPVFLPYLSGNVDLVGIGNVRVPLVPDDGLGSGLVVTPTMNGCALAITNVDESGFTAWHFQSPGSSKGADVRFRLDPDRRVTDWFGDAEYETPVKRGQYQAANILWHHEASGQWKIISQESDMLFGPRGEWLGLSKTHELSRELRLTPGGELAYTKKIYEGLAAAHRQKVDVALAKIDDKAIWSKEQYRLLEESLIGPSKRYMEEFRTQLLAQEDFAGLADLADSIRTRIPEFDGTEIRQYADSWSARLKPLESWMPSRPFDLRMDNLLAFLREYHNAAWAKHMASEAHARVAPPPQPGANA
ncbi:putative T7SS-secreted protein [Streptomyces telluris]|uniref:Putative T7SS secretion signal domain-containing protein n=1 Tax=Streptomyces telluris TaxID=2720021 RepID=A0A9X2RMI4_9ACTN|nr:hypothetical protein [Streptomyces telluris]MCQ8769396.1 hypothetical protein [Streptomyces telluris]NJP77776.1 hypothetical protein [Streptomyces telluris]